MKKVATTLFLMHLAFHSFSQVHGELGLGVDIPKGTFNESHQIGLAVMVEPKYAVHENIDLGLQLGIHAFGGAQRTPDGSEADFTIGTMIPVQLTAHYLFSSEKVTPFAGLGIGVAGFNSIATNKSESSLEEDNKMLFGVTPRVGISIGAVSFFSAYHIYDKTSFLQFGIVARFGKRAY